MENTEKQHLELIADMINVTRKEFSDDSYIYLIWGWAVSIACILEYVLLRMGKEYHAIVWAIFMPLAAITQLVMSYSRKRKVVARTRMDRLLGHVWIAVLISYFLVLFSQDVMQISTYPTLILLYGVGTFISGSIMNFRPMQIGAVCCWVIGYITFRVTFEYQLLLLPLSLILSYIIPGYMLKSRFSKNV